MVYECILCYIFFFFKQKTAYEMRISDWSSDVCSSDLLIMAKNLTTKDVENVKPGTARKEIPDALLPGLYLVVQPSGAKSWAVRYRHGGKPRKLTLGPLAPTIDGAPEPESVQIGRAHV